METLELSIHGMHCDGCANRLSSTLSKLTGIEKADVSYRNQSATIEFDPEQVTTDAIRNATAKAGFTIKPTPHTPPETPGNSS